MNLTPSDCAIIEALVSHGPNMIPREIADKSCIPFATVLSRLQTLEAEGEIFISGSRKSTRQKGKEIREFSAFEPDPIPLPEVPIDNLLSILLGLPHQQGVSA